MLLVFFFYGLSFWAMGLGVLLESGRAGSPRQARSLYWLAAFGLLHGTHEWFEAFLLQSTSFGAQWPDFVDWLRLAMLATSFACLFLYAVLSPIAGKSARGLGSLQYGLPIIFAAYVLVAASIAYRLAALEWINMLDAATRYILAIPATLLAVWALRSSAGDAAKAGQTRVTSNLELAAVAFVVYGITQAFVVRQSWFPASVINQESFLSTTGVPIQAVRAAMAVLISFGLLRALQAVERQRQTDWLADHQARIAALEQRDTMRRDLLRHIVRTQEDERARIARELHDQIAQLLAAFSLDLGTLRAALRRTDTQHLVDRLQERAREMSQALFHLVRGLRPSHLDNLGLLPALKFLVDQDYQPQGLDVRVNVIGRPRPLDGMIDTGLFRVAQESLTNVLRHAHVAHAEIELQYDCDSVRMRILDQGRGFDPDEDFNPPRGWGLAGMRERIESLSGHLCLRSSPDQGTSVDVVIPLDRVQKGPAGE